jgi:DNA-binding transcriptional ArsR family regulator
MADEMDLSSKYELYATNSGIVLLTSDIRMGIMKELAEDKLTLADLSRNMKVSQSTLATNLAKMTEDKLISTEPDQIDNRKVYYQITSVPIVRSGTRNDDAVQKADLALSYAAESPNNFLKGLLLNLSLKAEGEGIDIGPTFFKTGREFAIKLYDKVKADTVEQLMINVKTYLSESLVGEVSVFTFVPLTLILQNSSKFQFETDRLLTNFVFGFFTSLLKIHTGRDYRVISQEKYGNGMVKFTVDIVQPKN